MRKILTCFVALLTMAAVATGPARAHSPYTATKASPSMVSLWQNSSADMQDFITVTLTLGDGVAINGELPQGVTDNQDGTYEVTTGTSVSIVATAPEHFHFAGWSDLNAEDADFMANPRTVTLTADMTIGAVFSIDTYTITLSANNPAWGTLSVQASGNNNFLNPQPFSVVIGDSTSTTVSSYLPGYSLYDYSYSQQIYTAEEIGGSGNIVALTYWLKNNSSYARNLEIYMKEVSESSFETNTAWVSLSESDLVATYTMPNDISSPVRTPITLTTPFNYSGTGNLLIVIRDVTGTWSSGLGGIVSDAAGNQSIYAYRDGTVYDVVNPGVNGYLLDKRNVVQLFVEPVGASTTPAQPAQPFSVVIGDSTSTTVSSYLPGYSLYDYAYSQQIYTADEIGGSGNIVALTYWLKNNSSYARNLEIYMKEVSESSFETNTAWVSLSESDLVATYTMPNAISEPVRTPITLTTPFAYSGTGNLLIAIRDVTGSWSSGLGGIVSDGAENQSIYAYRDGTVYDVVNPGVNGYLLAPRNVVLIDVEPVGGGSSTPMEDVTVTIGDGTNTSYYCPFNSLWGYSFVEQVYTANEIGAAGTINSIAFNLRETDQNFTSNYVIYMKNVERDQFASNTDFEPVTEDDIVFNGSITFNPGWTTITLDTPFEYDGQSNLMIGFHETGEGYSTRYFYYSSVANAMISAHSDSDNPNPYNIGSYSGTTYTQNYRSNIQINMTTVGTAAPAITQIDDSTYMAEYGTEVIVTATPNANYRVTAWQDENQNAMDVAVYDDAVLDGPSTLTFTLTDDTTVSALFAYNILTLNLGVNNSEWGTVNVAGEGTAIYTYTFNDGLQGWTSIEGTGAQSAWIHSTANTGGYDYSEYSWDYLNNNEATGGFLVCYSYDEDNYVSLQANSILCSPQRYHIEAGATVSMWFSQGNDNYPEDSLRICVSTAETPTFESFVPFDTIAQNDNRLGGFSNWYQNVFDLSAYAGQDVWFGIYDKNYDEYEAYIDQCVVTLPGASGGLPDGVTATETAGVYNVLYGTELSLSASAIGPHHVAGWQDSSANTMEMATYAEGNFPATSTLTFTMTQDTAVIALFEANTYTLTLDNGLAVDGTPEGVTDNQDGTYAVMDGTQFDIAVTAPEHYHFTGWADLNEQDADFMANPRTVTVTSDTSFSALYGINSYLLTLTANNSEWGTVTLVNEAAAPAQQPFSVVIGDSTSTTNNPYIPSYSLYEYAYSQQIYTADEIGGSGNIVALTYWLKNSSSYARNLEIYMKEVSESSFESNAAWVSLSESDLVATYTMPNGTDVPVRTPITLTTPFAYSGTGNLLIAFRDVTGNWSSGLRGIVSDGAGNQSLYAYRDGTTYDLANPGVTGTLHTNRNVVQFDVEPVGGGSSTPMEDVTVTIGDGTNTSYYCPFNSLWGYSFVEQVYTANEIGAAGTINSIAFNMRENDSEFTSNYVIYMKNVERDQFALETGFEPVTADDIVFNGSITFNPGWTTITLDTPFEYDGQSNLMIGFHETGEGYSTRYFYYSSVANAMISAHSDSDNPNPYNIGSYSGTTYTQNYRSNIQINMTTGGTAAPATITQINDSTYSVEYGTEIIINAVANTDYHVEGWKDQNQADMDVATYGEGNLPTTSTLTFTFAGDTTVMGMFAQNNYEVIAVATNDNRETIGTGLPMGSVSASYTDELGMSQNVAPTDSLGFTGHFNTTSTLVATPAYGYIFDHWSAGDTTYATNATLEVDFPIVLLAVFVPDTFEVNATLSIATSAVLTGNGSFAYREMDTLSVAPATGYHFVEWQNATGISLGTDMPFIVQVMNDSTIIAVMDTNEYNVVANVNIEGLGTVTGAGQVKHFLSTDLVATANLGYHFVKWTNANGDSLSDNATLTVFPVSDTVLVAVFDTNIYATVWSGETTVTYNAEPYTGLGATYTDFWGVEHTAALTFTCGNTTITTPNYPVAAGTWTVTANGEEGDSLTNAVMTLTINPAVVYVSGATVENAKFADGTTDAVVSNIGTLNNVQGNDALTHNTVANYNDATVGDNKTITLTYSLVGTADLVANYILTPTTEVCSTPGYIIEPMNPDTEREGDDTTIVEDGIEIYAYGYCNGSSYNIRYHLSSGNPDQYKIDFADARFTDVAWTDLATAGANGTIEVVVPVDMPTGDYSLTVTFRDSRFTWLESNPITINFHVNLPETYTLPLFDDVIALVDTCHCLTDIQWYHRANSSEDWQAIPGANDYYYREPGGLTGEYFVRAKMNGVETYTCPQTDVETLVDDGMNDVTVTAYPNPTTDNVTVTISGSLQPVHTLRLINTVGVEMERRTFEGESTVIDMRNYQRGNYVVTIDGVVVRVIRN